MLIGMSFPEPVLFEGGEGTPSPPVRAYVAVTPAYMVAAAFQGISVKKSSGPDGIGLLAIRCLYEWEQGRIVALIQTQKGNEGQIPAHQGIDPNAHQGRASIPPPPGRLNPQGPPEGEEGSSQLVLPTSLWPAAVIPYLVERTKVIRLDKCWCCGSGE